MKFTKMHGAGNDYVYVDCFDEPVPANLPALAAAISDRHKGVGADGLILIGPSDRADARMRIFNADGSEAEMCGNGLRCVAKYVYDHGIARKPELEIETAAGVKTAELQLRAGAVEQVRVSMGPPMLRSEQIPCTLPGDPPVNQPLEMGGRHVSVTCVSFGNPHCVVFVEELSNEWVLGLGPQLEYHPAFPNRINVEFVQILSSGKVVMRVWERGSGETLACGSGACAAVVAGVLTGRTDRNIVAHLPGGDLSLEWSETEDVFLTGPAVEVFRGEWPG